MEYLFLYVAFFGGWAAMIYRRHGFNLPVFLLLLYAIGAICCMCILGFYPDYIKFPERITFPAVASHILLLWLFMYPLARYGNTLDIDDLKIATPRLDMFSWCVAVPAVLSMIASSMDIANIFIYRDFLAARNAFMEGDISNLYMDKYGALGYFLSLGPQVSILTTVLFCYYFFCLRRRGVLTWVLLAGTLAIVTNNLAIAGREGFVRWFLCMGAGMVLVRNHLDFKKNRRTFMVIGVVGAALVIMFAAITLDRFDPSIKGRSYGPFFSLLRYGGEQFYLYSYGYQRFFDAGYDTVAGLFPAVTRQVTEIYDVNSKVRADFFLNTFPTFVGTFVKRVGFFNTLALSIGAFFFFFLSFWRRNVSQPITLTRFVSYLFYYEFVLIGFFYYLHGGAMTQYSIIFYILLAYCLSRYTLKSNLR